MEKDNSEIELEKIVFGDQDGFHSDLRSYNNRHTFQISDIVGDSQQESQEELVDKAPEGLDDADLFFLDSGPSAESAQALLATEPSPDRESQADDQDTAAWIDSDDERIAVSLASNPRLRKLRVAESEDLINGKEYVKRLRRQFVRLCPVPEWADYPAAAAVSRVLSRKRRRFSSGSDSSEAMVSGNGISVDYDELSTPPLSKLLQNTGTLALSTSATLGRKYLRSEIIDVHRTKDVATTPHVSSQILVKHPGLITSSFLKSPISSLAFHPEHALLLSSGPSGTLFLHNVSPHSFDPNPQLSALHVRSTPLTTSAFSPPSGTKILFSGRRRYFHVWDLHTGKVEKISRITGHGEVQKNMERFKISPCGRWVSFTGSSRKGGGMVNILDANTCQWIAEVRVEGHGGVADFDWWGNGQGMLIVGKGGEVVEWDGRRKRVVAKWMDEGAVGTTTVVLGGKTAGPQDIGGDRWVAMGSSSGIVNVYDRRKWLKAEGVPKRPKPAKVFDQLTTPISHLHFSPDGQILCLSSRWKRDALRLVHLPSCTVYKNWPTSSTPLGRVTAVAWAPNSEMFAVSNEQGKIRLWEIRR